MRTLLLIMGCAVAFGCGDDDGTAADRLGVGAQCSSNDDCLDTQGCLSQFRGGYCGLSNCDGDADCPNASACVAHDDGKNYCFRICVDKAECNRNRDPDNEANCSSNVAFVDNTDNVKACVPPSSGDEPTGTAGTSAADAGGTAGKGGKK